MCWDGRYMTERDALSNLGKWINCDAFHKDIIGTEFMGINKLGLSKIESQDYTIPGLVLS